MRLQGKKIILGVCGSIAAYKAVFLLRLLQQEGAEVRVVLTPSAAKFVSPLTFSALAHHPVFTDLWDEAGSWSAHVQWGLWADLMIVAPCTANTLSKLAHGACDDALTAVALSLRSPLMVCAAMDLEMYAHPATQANKYTLTARGVHWVAPESGYLASGLEGAGRMAEPAHIVDAVCMALQPKTLVNKKILISAGPTQEALDPVRYISNHSTGKMGIAIATSAVLRGADVTLVLGPSNEPIPTFKNLQVVHVVSAQDMYTEMTQRQPHADCIIMSAAVADFKLQDVKEQKIKKEPGQTTFTLTLTTTQDILATLGQNKTNKQVLVGFALETNNAIANAKKKLVSKKLDCIILNTLEDEGAGFGHNTNRVTIINAQGTETPLPLKNKTELAHDILLYLEQQYALGTPH